VKVRDDGPYKLTGPLTIVDVEGVAFDVPPGDAVVLCRCGLSQDKPFCDGSHKASAFRSAERA